MVGLRHLGFPAQNPENQQSRTLTEDILRLWHLLVAKNTKTPLYHRHFVQIFAICAVVIEMDT